MLLFILEFKNVATENDLGLFSYLTKSSNVFQTNNENLVNDPDITKNPTFIGDDGKIYEQRDNQFIWILNKAVIDGTDLSLYGGSNTISQNPDILLGDYTNLGNIGGGTSNFTLLDSNNDIWITNSSTTTTINKLGSTVHPKVKQIRNSLQNTSNQETNELVDANMQGVHIIESQNSQNIPIEIYFKPDLYKTNNVDYSVTTSNTPHVLKKALRFRIEEESSTRPFEFTIIFKLISHRQYVVESGVSGQIGNFQTI